MAFENFHDLIEPPFIGRANAFKDHLMKLSVLHGIRIQAVETLGSRAEDDFMTGLSRLDDRDGILDELSQQVLGISFETMRGKILSEDARSEVRSADEMEIGIHFEVRSEEREFLDPVEIMGEIDQKATDLHAFPGEFHPTWLEVQFDNGSWFVRYVLFTDDHQKP